MAGAMAAHARCAMVRDLHRVTSEEQLFASAYNASPPTAQGAGVKWALRGYLPPKHLRIPGIDYGVPEDSAMTMFGGDISPSVVGRESISDLLAGCFAAAQSGVDADAVMDEDGVSEVTVTEQNPHERVVKGGMASRPSWGQNNYAAQREKLAAAYRKSPDGSPKG